MFESLLKTSSAIDLIERIEATNVYWKLKICNSEILKEKKKNKENPVVLFFLLKHMHFRINDPQDAF